MNHTATATPPPSTSAALAADEFDELVEQLKEAYPSATDRLLAQAITESGKEVGNASDRESLLRCIRERITA